MSKEELELERLAEDYIAYAEQIVKDVLENPVSHSLAALRFARQLLDLGKEGVKKELRRLALQFGGCVSCRHSTPLPHYINLIARGCRLGLSQETCKRWEPLV